MWDAWAAYDPVADGYFVDEKDTATDVQAARERGHQLRRLPDPVGALCDGGGCGETLAEFDADDDRPLLRPVGHHDTGPTPAALGNRIAAAVIASGSPTAPTRRMATRRRAYKPVNTPLIVKRAGHQDEGPQPLAAAGAR